MIADMASLSSTIGGVTSGALENASAFLHNRTNATAIGGPSHHQQDWTDLLVLVVKGFVFGTIIVSAVLGNALVIISVHR